MIDFQAIVKNTNAYRVIAGDKQQNRLSHAYLLLCPDSEFLQEYLKVFASVIACDSVEPCKTCRTCTLIGKKMHPDVIFFPKEQGSVMSGDINELIEETYLKPLEISKKVFVIDNAHTMNASAQNKLLKTLEEPPEGVHILLGATSEFALLPTIKSRVRKLEMPFFNKEVLKEALKGECPDEKRLEQAIDCAFGTVGKALSNYGDEQFLQAKALCLDVLGNMQSSKDVLLFTDKVVNSQVAIDKFLSVLELYLRDILAVKQGREDLVISKSELEKIKGIERFNTGSCVHALESVTEAHKRLKFNATPTMLVEWLLFQILEGKYKWQKL